MWWDNWSGLGALANYIPNIGRNVKLPVKYSFSHGIWESQKIKDIFSVTLASQLYQVNIGNADHDDDPVWIDTHDGKFSSKPVWHIVRHKKTIINQDLGKLWHKDIPFNEVVTSIGINSNGTCYCC